MAYVGIYGCGCVRSATVDDPNHRALVRRDVSGFMRQGATIERWPIEKARAAICLAKHRPECPHPQACPEIATASTS